MSVGRPSASARRPLRRVDPSGRRRVGGRHPRIDVVVRRGVVTQTNSVEITSRDLRSPPQAGRRLRPFRRADQNAFANSTPRLAPAIPRALLHRQAQASNSMSPSRRRLLSERSSRAAATPPATAHRSDDASSSAEAEQPPVDPDIVVGRHRDQAQPGGAWKPRHRCFGDQQTFSAALAVPDGPTSTAPSRSSTRSARCMSSGTRWPPRHRSACSGKSEEQDPTVRARSGGWLTTMAPITVGPDNVHRHDVRQLARPHHPVLPLSLSVLRLGPGLFFLTQ